MSEENVKNVFVIGLDEANLPTLQAVPGARSLRFHGLLTVEELQDGEVSVPDILEKAQRELDAFEGSIDAIVGYWDFPVSTLVPILGERYGTRTTSLESVVKCEHKYWSRLEQREVTDCHPRFGRVDLRGDPPRPPEGVSFPMWLKPALSYSSELAFGVGDEEEFRKAVTEIRDGISRVGRPFERILDRIDLPPEMDGVGGRVCLAEEECSGIQVAVEGYVHQGEVTVYGTLDSIDYPDSACFLRHQYPSTLPPQVIRRLHDVTERVMSRIGFDSATFSVEYFYDPSSRRINLLEINPATPSRTPSCSSTSTGCRTTTPCWPSPWATTRPCRTGRGRTRWPRSGTTAGSRTVWCARCPRPRRSRGSSGRHRACGSTSCPRRGSDCPTSPSRTATATRSRTSSPVGTTRTSCARSTTTAWRRSG
ncbi:hypothetical protein RKD42_000717 [Streptomyces ambofaciens]